MMQCYKYFPRSHTHTQTQTHTRIHTRTHAHTHAYSRIPSVSKSDGRKGIWLVSYICICTRLKKLHPLSKRLTTVGIMWAQLRVPLKTFNKLILWWYEEFKRGLQLAPNDAGRRWSLGQLYVWSLLFYQKGVPWCFSLHFSLFSQ